MTKNSVAHSAVIAGDDGRYLYIYLWIKVGDTEEGDDDK